MSYRIVLDKFEGPFDLLLFLIHKHEVDIYDIPIADITSQFIDYVDRADQINLAHAGEFIDMIATLMKIKAVMLLLRPKVDETDEPVEDPRTELVQRLIEYRRFKEAAQDLRDLEEAHEWIKSRGYFEYLKKVHQDFENEETAALSDLTLYDLIKAFKRVIDSIPKVTEHQVRRISVTVEQQSSKIRRFLQDRKLFYFSELLKDTPDPIMKVVSFISILELTKVREIDLEQEELFTDIRIRAVEEKQSA